MTDRVFLDTNILVYSRDANYPEKREKSLALIEKLWLARTGRLSVQVLNEYFVTVTRKLNPGLSEESAWEDLELLSTWDPLPLDFTMLKTARDLSRKYTLSWWDSLIVAAARQSGCTLLASEDLSPSQEYAGVRVFNPFLE